MVGKGLQWLAVPKSARFLPQRHRAGAPSRSEIIRYGSDHVLSVNHGLSRNCGEDIAFSPLTPALSPLRGEGNHSSIPWNDYGHIGSWSQCALNEFGGYKHAAPLELGWRVWAPYPCPAKRDQGQNMPPRRGSRPWDDWIHGWMHS